MSTRRFDVEGEREKAMKQLSQTCLFQSVDPKVLAQVASQMERVEFKPGERLGALQDEPQDSMYVVLRGSVVRERREGTRGKRVDEGPRGMGDVPDFAVSVAANGDGTATVTVVGPDVDGLLAAVSRSLFSAGLSIVAVEAGGDAGKAGVRDAFTVRRSGGEAWEGGSAALGRVRSAVLQACQATVLGGLRFYGVNSFGTLHVVDRLPAFATTTAVSHGVAYRLDASAVEAVVGAHARGVVSGLCAEIFRMSETYEPLPLFEQPPNRVNAAAVSVAAAFEAYYRAMLNTLLNSTVSSVAEAPATMFPNMSVQIPFRMLYINGFKLLRQALDDALLASSETAETADGGASRAPRPPWERWIPALLPGVLMTPVSSVLEACNAEYANPEPLLRRAARGAAPRCGREVVFGVGLNNLADYCEERVPRDVAQSKLARNALGSCVAGVVAGYLSHVPHNLSTLAMLEPGRPYRAHWANLVHNARVNRLPANLPCHQAQVLANALALFLPAGLLIRTTQIVGSFCLLNGISHALDVSRTDA